MLEQACAFSNHLVAVEHKHMKDDMRSATSGAIHGASSNAAACRHLRDIAIQIKMGDPTKVLEPQRLPALQMVSYRPFYAKAAKPASSTRGRLNVGPVDDAGPTDGAAGDGLHDGEIATPDALAQIGGGTPKVMHANYKLHREKEAGIQRTRTQTIERRKELNTLYDTNARLKASWDHIYQLHRKRKARARPVVNDEENAEGAACEIMWRNTYQVDGDHSAAPIHPERLVHHYYENYGIIAALAEAAVEVDINSIIDADYVKKRTAGLGDTWGWAIGFASCLHNVCQRYLRNEREYTQLLRSF